VRPNQTFRTHSDTDNLSFARDRGFGIGAEVQVLAQ